MARIHHVNVVVPKGATDRVAAFYRDLLGLQPTSRPGGLRPGGAWFDIDSSSQLHISERDGEQHPDAHFALVLDDFAGVTERLRAAGAPLEPGEELFGGGRAFTRDPAGNRVELLEQAGQLS